jgi:hypothetical protein
MSKIKFLKSPIGLGIAHRAGEVSVSLADDLKQMLVENGYAEYIPEEKPKRTPPEVVAPRVAPKENTSVKKATKASPKK